MRGGGPPADRTETTVTLGSFNEINLLFNETLTLTFLCFCCFIVKKFLKMCLPEWNSGMFHLLGTGKKRYPKLSMFLCLLLTPNCVNL